MFNSPPFSPSTVDQSSSHPFLSQPNKSAVRTAVRSAQKDHLTTPLAEESELSSPSTSSLAKFLSRSALKPSSHQTPGSFPPAAASLRNSERTSSSPRPEPIRPVYGLTLLVGTTPLFPQRLPQHGLEHQPTLPCRPHRVPPAQVLSLLLQSMWGSMWGKRGRLHALPSGLSAR